MKPTFSPANLPERLQSDFATVSTQSGRVVNSTQYHLNKISKSHTQRLQMLGLGLAEFQKSLAQAVSSGQSLSDAKAYAIDAAQRALLTLDVLRERGNNDKAHEEAGTPPVLDYKYDVIIDGRDLPRPVNYLLLKILPAEGVEVFD